MKEKETATCPICGGELQTQGQAFFKEHHKRLWEKKCRECGVASDMSYSSFGKTYSKIYSISGVDVKDKPTALIRWEAENPIPEDDFIDFIVKLAQRLLGLQVKKGGTL